MERYKKPSLVAVEWIDATGYDNLNGPLGEILETAQLALRETTGLLLYQDDHRTILAHDCDKPLPGVGEHEHRYGNITVLPTGWIRKVRYVERKGKKQEAPVVKSLNGATIEVGAEASGEASPAVQRGSPPRDL